jgi:hypothetical protein
MNNPLDLHLLIYLMLGALIFTIAIAGTIITYLLRNDVKTLLNHFEIDRINRTLYQASILDGILIPLSMLFLSIRKRLVFIDISLYFFGAFGLTVFYLSLRLLKSGLSSTPPDYQCTIASLFNDLDIISSLIYILCFIVVFFYRFQINSYKNHCKTFTEQFAISRTNATA